MNVSNSRSCEMCNARPLILLRQINRNESANALNRVGSEFSVSLRSHSRGKLNGSKRVPRNCVSLPHGNASRDSAWYRDSRFHARRNGVHRVLICGEHVTEQRLYLLREGDVLNGGTDLEIELINVQTKNFAQIQNALVTNVFPQLIRSFGVLETMEQVFIGHVFHRIGIERRPRRLSTRTLRTKITSLIDIFIVPEHWINTRVWNRNGVCR